MMRIFVLMMLFVIAEVSFAFRCHNSLVNVGDTQEFVSNTCGEPKLKKVLSTHQAVYDGKGVKVGSLPFLTEDWLYQLTPQSFK